MINTQDRQAFSDVSIIIQMMPDSMKRKINQNFIKFIEDNKDTEYISNINKKIPLKNQALNETTKTVLALIYRDYLCSDSEREKLLQQEKKEIKEKEEEIRREYEIQFKNNKIERNEIGKNEAKEDTSLVIYKKDSVIKKIFNKIKMLLNNNR